ncbi:hypothetical protein RchiOBHm_Chr6g0283491 [Rosa chinensis]|uniref:Uncharacterized protein n=1 Tax=Rosa chinensis TaxID=74649 RepID=A0A2P6PU08_ROSCH|nr:hypothetical protein RchiOBHm_Chr6g0283491 [Rosa chinensis]
MTTGLTTYTAPICSSKKTTKLSTPLNPTIASGPARPYSKGLAQPDPFDPCKMGLKGG